MSDEYQKIVSGRECRRLWSPVSNYVWGTFNSCTVNRSCKKISLEVDCCGDGFYGALQFNSEALHSLFYSWDQYRKEKGSFYTGSLSINSTSGDINSPFYFSTNTNIKIKFLSSGRFFSEFYSMFAFSLCFKFSFMRLRLSEKSWQIELIFSHLIYLYKLKAGKGYRFHVNRPKFKAGFQCKIDSFQARKFLNRCFQHFFTDFSNRLLHAYSDIFAMNL